MDLDNHIVLIDPKVKNPTMAKDEIRSVTAEFTPRTRLDHPNFTRTKLNRLIRPSEKLLVRVTGLLLFDSRHFFHDSPPVARDTNWEIHPVLKMEYCPDGKTWRANSDENWKDLDNDKQTSVASFEMKYYWEAIGDNLSKAGGSYKNLITSIGRGG